MTRNHLKRISLQSGLLLGTFSLIAAPASALASVNATTATSGTSKADQTKITYIISHGNTEINRRVTTLNALSSKISSATKLSASDQSSLSGSVNDELSNLNSLKTKLDADTDLATAKSDAQSIITDYRVYALVVPQVNLVKTADDQQVAEAKLGDLAVKLQSRITAAGAAGKTVTSLQAQLSDLNTKIAAAQAISSTIETNVVALQPSDYDSNHAVLSGDRDQLKTAQADIQAALSDAKGIVASLKTL